MYRAGEVLSEYQLVRPLGEGALGVTWLAQRVDRRERAALKLIRPERVKAPVRLEAFDRLANALTRLGRLEHPNLPPVLGTARRFEDGVFGLASGYSDGGTFDGVGSPADPVVLDRALSLLLQLGRVLDWLHGQGIVHGNVKPSNVLVAAGTAGPKVQLLDLVWTHAGLARRTEDTRRFVAPEVLAKRPLSPAADQWSSAKLLHDMVVKGGDGGSPTERLAAVPLPVLRVLERAISTEPEARYHRTAGFVQALENARTELGAAGGSARPASGQAPSPTMELSASAVQAIELSVSDAEAVKEEARTEDMPAAHGSAVPEAGFDAGEMPTVRHEVAAGADPTAPTPVAVPSASGRGAAPDDEGDAPDWGELDLALEREPSLGPSEPVKPSDPTDVLHAANGPEKKKKRRRGLEAGLMMMLAAVVIAASGLMLLDREPAPAGGELVAAPTPSEPPKGGAGLVPGDAKRVEDAPPEGTAIADLEANRGAEGEEADPADTPGGEAARRASEPTGGDDAEPAAKKPPPPVPAARRARLPEVDPREARCEKGQRSACLALAKAYRAGDGVPASRRKATRFSVRACRLGSTKACAEAGKLLEAAGDGKQARRMYERACDARHGEACAKLARLWRDGIGGLAKARTAAAFERRACQLGYPPACE